jgi:hypothetical protein
MPFNVHFERLPGFARYQVAGVATLAAYSELIEQAARETIAAGDRHALVDLRGVVGRLAFSDQFFIGELVVRKLQHLRKVATVVPEDPATYNSEKVASRRGFSLRGFLREEDAREWLLGVE